MSCPTIRLCFCRYPSLRDLAATVLLAVLALGSCRAQPKPDAGPSKTFQELLSKGDYAGALAFVASAQLPQNERDGISGILILDGLVDPKALTKPPYTLTEGFARLERAAAAGRHQSVSDLRAKFSTGIHYEGRNRLMAPNPPLAKCWLEARDGAMNPAVCIEMRQKLNVP